ncbi:flagellar export chaperone FliS [Rhodoferax sp. OV413]|uniref:flagellar export chaperone FliS n=1 Tax=Rhodoferax sp. OV413 TaxID=1855285 RepID=UPI0035169BD6
MPITKVSSPMESTTMFTPVSARAASAYKRVGAQTSVEGASPHQVVCLLFEALMQSLYAARGCIDRGDLEGKGNALSKAVRILDEGLKLSLDIESGGDLALNLRGVYNYSILQLTTANLKNDAALVDEVVQLIAPVFDAWKSIAVSPVAKI